MVTQINWKTILIIGLTAVLCLGFYYGYKIFKMFQTGLEGLEGFQAASVSIPSWEPGPESSDEIMTYDAFELANTPNVGETMPTNMDKYDSSAALAEFDDGAPVPWDFDNKDDDPVDVLWGYVDTRCSMYLWERARMRALFGTANNFEVGDDGKIAYYSGYLNGMVFHDESQINAVKYLEFFIDFYSEQVIEGALDIIKPSVTTRLYAKAAAAVEARKALEAGEKAWKTMDNGIEKAKAARTAARQAGQNADDAFRAAFKANINADDFLKLQPLPARTLDQVIDDMLQEAQRVRSGAGATTSVSVADDAFERAFKSRGAELTGALSEKAYATEYAKKYNAKLTELLPATKAAEEATRGTGYLARAKGAVDDVLKGVKTAIKQTLKTLAKPFLRIATLSAKKLGTLGEKYAAIALAKMAAKRLGRIMSLIASKFYYMSAAIALLPVPVNAVLAGLDLIFTIVVLAIIPQVLSVMADLDEEPDSDNCNDNKQGCPATHPFNMRCAMIKSTSPAFYEFFTAIPTVGDIIGSFAPYICMNDKLESVFRQSMRPPPYFFDTSLSLFYCEKPNVMDGSTGRGDPMYYDPGLFKLYNNRTNSVTLDRFGTMPEGTKNYFVPWVDFAHPVMLNKMAEFYLKNSKKNQSVDMDGFVSFEFISNFKGVIASSQLSCDIQAELREIRMRPLSNQPVDLDGAPIVTGDFTFPIPSPWEIDATSTDPSQQRWKGKISSSAETGYTFHDRRFYFIVDYKQVTSLPRFRNLDFRGLDSAEITDLVQQALTRVSSAERMEAYRAMYVVCGCTHVNGCAADIIDITADGNYLGDAPVSLGNNSRPYLAPVLDLTAMNPNGTYNNPNDLISTIPQSDQCGAARSVINKYGVRGFGPSKADKNSNKSSDGGGPVIYLPDDSEFYGVTEDTTITKGASVPNTSNLPATAAINEVCMVTSEQRQYIYTTYRGVGIYPLNSITALGAPATGWFPYNPQPVWKAKSNEPQFDTWLQCTTKFWQVTPITASLKENLGSGLLGATMALGPLLFGFKGGMAVTTADVGGISNLIACTYLDMVNQTGTFVINGFVKTSQDKFIIDKGPAIRYAPGWVPDNAYTIVPAASRVARATGCSPAPTSTEAFSLKCPPRILNQGVCANRKGIRIMAKIYSTQASGRRVKRIFSILPAFDTNTQRNACTYDIHSVDILPDGTDGNEIQTETIVIPYQIEQNSKTCEFVPVTDTAGNANYYTRTPINVMRPISPDMTAFNPPLSEREFNALQNRVDKGFVPISCTTSTTIGGALNTLAQQTISTTSGSQAIKRAAAERAIAERFNCGTTSIKDKLVGDFNKQFQKVAGDESKGHNVKILNIAESKTPLPVGGARGIPVCHYKASVAVQKNYYDTSPTTETHYIKMNLQSDPENSCGYTIMSHDFPVNYYNVPIPNEGNAPFEMPVEVIGQKKLERSGCDYNTYSAYSDCSGLPIIDTLVTQFNAKYEDRKILRVTRAATPRLSSGQGDVCEYEVDMMRKTGSGQSIIERDTIRMTLTPGVVRPNNEESKCMFDLDSDSSSNRFSGKTINKNSSAQLLKSDYMWPTNFATRIRNSMRSIIGTITRNDIVGAMDRASKGVNTKMKTLTNVVKTGGGISGCPNTQCMSKEIVAGFINRYNYDNAPPYPEGQFGVKQRSIVSVRRAGLATPNRCHIEVVEKIQDFVNYLKEPKPGNPVAPDAADKLIRNELKFYAFSITNSSTGPNGICNFKITEFPTDDKGRKEMDVSTNPYGIQDGIGSNILMPASFVYAPRVINGFNIGVLNAVRNAIATLPPMNQFYLGDTIIGAQIETIKSYCNVRPNVVEYVGTIAERIRVPDLGLVDVSGTEAIITCTWPEDRWDPTTASFPGATWNDLTATYEGGSVSQPIVEIFIPDRVEIINQDVTLYGRVYPNPPYMYLGADVDSTTEVGKIMYINPANKNSYIKSFANALPPWRSYADATSIAETFVGSGSPTISGVLN